MKRIFVVMGLVAALGAEDADGCRDPRLLKRLPGCEIETCDRKGFDAAAVLLGVKDGADVEKEIEGEVETAGYHCPMGVSGLQIARNAAGALRQAGYQIVFQGKDAYSENAVTGRKGAAWVTVRTMSDGRYGVTAVVEKAMEQEMTAGWAEALEKTGRVAVYGIEFATGSAAILPESEKVLGQVAALLQGQAGVRFRVEGHTDATGTAAGNLKLSEQRAAAVVAWLVKNGVEAGRLQGAGLGAGKPVATNDTEEGRAKNRRVELARVE